MSAVAVIPARGGSTRIPQKNIKPFYGKPIIAYSIEAAKAAGLFSDIIVSTDSPEIAAIASEYGASVPFFREESLSDDNTPFDYVTIDVLEKLREQKKYYDYACSIYATAPFISPDDISKGFSILQNQNVNVVLSVCHFSYSPFRAMTISDSGRLSMIWPEHELTRSQDLPKCYEEAAHFIWADVEKFLKERKTNASSNAAGVIIPRWRTFDVDTEEDWRLAEIMYEVIKKHRVLM